MPVVIVDMISPINKVVEAFLKRRVEPVNFELLNVIQDDDLIEPHRSGKQRVNLIFKLCPVWALALIDVKVYCQKDRNIVLASVMMIFNQYIKTPA